MTKGKNRSALIEIPTSVEQDPNSRMGRRLPEQFALELVDGAGAEKQVLQIGQNAPTANGNDG